MLVRSKVLWVVYREEIFLRSGVFVEVDIFVMFVMCLIWMIRYGKKEGKEYI